MFFDVLSLPQWTCCNKLDSGLKVFDSAKKYHGTILATYGACTVCQNFLPCYLEQFQHVLLYTKLYRLKQTKPMIPLKYASKKPRAAISPRLGKMSSGPSLVASVSFNSISFTTLSNIFVGIAHTACTRKQISEHIHDRRSP